MADSIHDVTLLVPKMFGPLDMAVVIGSLAAATGIGIYFAYFAPTGDNEEADYLFGGRNMGVLPIALSLVASHISAITILGLPAEVYVYGYQVFYSALVYWAVSYVYCEQLLPVFHDLQGLSLNEYFLKRFNKQVRVLISVMYFMHSILFLPIACYLPALAYEQVTGHNIHYVSPVVGLVCIFYTSLGGVRAVVWTDAIQMISMLICVILVAVKGTHDVGGLSVIWERNVASGRLEAPYMDLDPTVRHTIFGILIHSFFITLEHGYLNQVMIQRHQSLQTLRQAKRAVWIFTCLLATMVLLCWYCGLVVAAYYYSCDPISMKLARVKDQIMPLFVMQTIGHIPGLAGVFISGVFSAALSSISGILNTSAGIFVEDWIRGCTTWNPSDHQATWIMRIVSVVLGVITLSLVFVVEKLGMVLQMAFSFNAASAGSLLTVFLLGLFVPWVSSTGALVGAAVAFFSTSPLIFGTQFFISQGLVWFPAKPVSLKGCTSIYNVSAEFMRTVHPPLETMTPARPTGGDVWYIFRISYLWYLPISLICGLSAGILVTIFASRLDLRSIDRKLIAPISRRWLPKDAFDAPERGYHIALENFEKPV